jgi:hypothetical protein
MKAREHMRKDDNRISNYVLDSKFPKLPNHPSQKAPKYKVPNSKIENSQL